jgi:NADH:ubiquinone oxidoreductase subunit 2 (subunit N)
MLLAAPELWVLVMACVILVVDLFLSKERRGIIQLLAMGTLVFAAIITLRAEYLADGARSAIAFNGSFIRDPMGDVLKVFSFIIMGLIFTYSKFYLRSFKMFRADFFTLSLFALLGVMLLISANSMLMIIVVVLPSPVHRSAVSAESRSSPLFRFIIATKASAAKIILMQNQRRITGPESSARKDHKDIK